MDDNQQSEHNKMNISDAEIKTKKIIEGTSSLLSSSVSTESCEVNDCASFSLSLVLLGKKI